MPKIPLIFSLFLFAMVSHANNLTLKNGSVNLNSLSLEIAWDNSWNFSENGGNHDAVWIFLKGKNQSGDWVHIDLSSESLSHFAESPLIVEAVNDGKGIFIFSSQIGSYSISSSQLAISTTTSLSSFSEIKVFGIEMVHIPEGIFYIGDGASISSFSGLTGNPVLISSEEEIDCSTMKLNNPNTVFDPHPLPEKIPSSFPKGFSGFYVMKYEISQIQYVDFLNTLSFNQQHSRTAISPASPAGTFAMVNPNQPDSLYRNGIIIVNEGIETEMPAVYGMNANSSSNFNDESDGLHRAANFLSWADVSAYLDWAALRPISEFEFEKICRGAENEPVAGEFAWGTNLITNANSPINDGTLFEGVSETADIGAGLANHGNIVSVEGWGLRGVLRNGFAAKVYTNRLESGSAFYGVMEMSGNVWEQTVMAANEGVNFTGNAGDGQLDENGYANQTSWCNPTTANGILLKGGGWGSTISEVGSYRDLAVSDRFYSHLKPSQRLNTTGGRGAR